jgi:hypothetical protein
MSRARGEQKMRIIQQYLRADFSFHDWIYLRFLYCCRRDVIQRLISQSLQSNHNPTTN